MSSIRLTRDVGILQTQMADMHAAVRAIELRLVALEEAVSAPDVLTPPLPITVKFDTEVVDRNDDYEIIDQGGPRPIIKRGPGRPRKDEPKDAA